MSDINKFVRDLQDEVTRSLKKRTKILDELRNAVRTLKTQTLSGGIDKVASDSRTQFDAMKQEIESLSNVHKALQPTLGKMQTAIKNLEELAKKYK